MTRLNPSSASPHSTLGMVRYLSSTETIRFNPLGRTPSSTLSVKMDRLAVDAPPSIASLYKLISALRIPTKSKLPVDKGPRIGVLCLSSVAAYVRPWLAVLSTRSPVLWVNLTSLSCPGIV